MESRNRFPLSENHPSEYSVTSPEDAICVDIALALEEPTMRYILARRHQFGGVAEIQSAYGDVKEQMRAGKCRNPRALFNFLLTKALREKV